jgi:hypothetical protein
MEPSRAGALLLQPLTVGHRPAAGGTSRHTQGAAGHRTEGRKRGNDGGATKGHGSAFVALQPASLHWQQHQPAAALQHQPAAALQHQPAVAL